MKITINLERIAPEIYYSARNAEWGIRHRGVHVAYGFAEWGFGQTLPLLVFIEYRLYAV